MDIVIDSSRLGDQNEAEIVSWLVEDGATVQKDQPIAELETAKVTLEVPAPAGGTLKILVAKGELIEPGATIGRIL